MKVIVLTSVYDALMVQLSKTAQGIFKYSLRD